MRITNQMMTTNMLNNINRNKKNVDTLGYQYATQQKIEKPSDDPVVAVRSLKYRTQITELEQYLGKNIPDAKNWMDTAESAMKSVNSVLEYMSSYCNNGATDTLETSDRNSIIETLKQYKDQIYSDANADYAGRYLFTGFRTDTPLLYDKAALTQQEANNTIYTIKENLSFSDVTSKTYVKGGASYAPGTAGDVYAQNAASTATASRLKLSYTNLDKGPDSTVTQGANNFTRKTGIQSITLTNPSNPADTITVDDTGTSGYTLTTMSLTDGTQGKCYSPSAKEIIFIPETGELVFGSDAYAIARKNSDYSVAYTKTKFEEDDIMPQHYFECSTSEIVIDSSNGSYKNETCGYSNPDSQKIDYEINFSQKLTVNTLAKDAVSTTIGTKVDEIVRAVNDVYDIKDKISEVEKLITTETNETELSNLKELKSQLETEQTLKKSILRESFSSGMTMAQEAQDMLNVALANHGSRYKRLQLTESRLKDQKTSFTALLDDNDKVELEDSVINYKQAQVVYDASLSCASTVISKTLLDYL
ncbi:MAG: hypothetical protein ACERKN_09605 [Velocimicrobium sp.]